MELLPNVKQQVLSAQHLTRSKLYQVKFFNFPKFSEQDILGRIQQTTVFFMLSGGIEMTR